MHRFARWREALQAAHTEQDVRKALEAYVATLAPVLGVLPEDVRSALDSDDIQGSAVTLLQAEMRQRETDELSQLLHEIAHTYAAASVRLAKIRREPLTPV